ncbi:MAG: hypothetical protein KF688_18350 [Pirellulales bacterium]|nr:hypothetical protein [Pirellulales bacterium]
MTTRSSHLCFSIVLRTAALASLLVAATVGDAWGHGAGGDVAVFTTGGQVDVGFAVLDDNDEFREFFDPADSVFQTILVPQVLGGLAVGSTEPGYDAFPGDLPPGAQLTYNVLGLEYWDGVGTPSFAPPVWAEASFFAGPVSISANGSFHHHPLFGIRDLTPDGLPLPDGVYAAKLSLSVTGLLDSDPFYMLALVIDALGADPDPADAAEQLGEAIMAYQEDPLGNPEPTYGGVSYAYLAAAVAHYESFANVPEPTGALLCAASVLGLLCVRRRR